MEGADGWAEDEKEDREEDKKWVANFWRAFDSLSLRQDDAYDLLQQRGSSPPPSHMVYVSGNLTAGLGRVDIKRHRASGQPAEGDREAGCGRR
jgi:hypothetical protein